MTCADMALQLFGNLDGDCLCQAAQAGEGSWEGAGVDRVEKGWKSNSSFRLFGRLIEDLSRKISVTTMQLTVRNE